MRATAAAAGRQRPIVPLGLLRRATDRLAPRRQIFGREPRYGATEAGRRREGRIGPLKARAGGRHVVAASVVLVPCAAAHRSASTVPATRIATPASRPRNPVNSQGRRGCNTQRFVIVVVAETLRVDQDRPPRCSKSVARFVGELRAQDTRYLRSPMGQRLLSSAPSGSPTSYMTVAVAQTSSSRSVPGGRQVPPGGLGLQEISLSRKQMRGLFMGSPQRKAGLSTSIVWTPKQSVMSVVPFGSSKPLALIVKQGPCEVVVHFCWRTLAENEMGGRLSIVTL